MVLTAEGLIRPPAAYEAAVLTGHLQCSVCLEIKGFAGTKDTHVLTYGGRICCKMFSLETEEHVGRGRNWHRTVFCGGLLYAALEIRVNSNW